MGKEQKKASDLLYGKRTKRERTHREPVPTSTELMRSLAGTVEELCSFNNDWCVTVTARDKIGEDKFEALSEAEQRKLKNEVLADQEVRDGLPFINTDYFYEGQETVQVVKMSSVIDDDSLSIHECARKDDVWYVTGKNKSGKKFFSRTFQELHDEGISPIITYAFTKIGIDAWPVWGQDGEDDDQ